MKRLKISRRAFLTRAGIAGAAFTGYAGFCEPSWLDTGRHEITTGAGGEPVRILHLADLHASWCVSLSYIDEAIRRGLALQPDLICVTGDFITMNFHDLDGYTRVLSRLSKAAPVFASLGNHDGGRWAVRHGGRENTEWVRDLLQQSRIELLHNRSTDLRIKGRDLRVTGVGDLYAREVQPEKAFPAATAGPQPYGIVMAHNPDSKKMLAPYAWDLMLSGHTHGGQFRLPLIGAPFAPVRDKRFIAGLYCWEDRHLHITKGVGNVWGLRFNCRPEVSLLTLA
jgi:hypothetical protein